MNTVKPKSRLTLKFNTSDFSFVIIPTIQLESGYSRFHIHFFWLNINIDFGIRK